MFPKHTAVILAISIVIFSQTYLTQAQSWTQLFPTGSAPTTREAHSAVYDITNNRMTIFGGYFYDSTAHFLNDVWILSTANGLDGTPAWIQLAPLGSAPTTRDAHTAVYDTIHNRSIIFAGYNGNAGYLNDVWVLSNTNGLDSTTSTWTQLIPTGSAPTTRESHTAVYDAVNNRMIVFAGAGNAYYNDVWVLSNANGLDSTSSAWIQLTPTGSAPTTRYAQTAIYDTTNNRMTVFGGYRQGSDLNDVWVLSYANGLGGTPAWTQLTPTGSAPTTRRGHTAVYDSTNNRMTIFGGFSGSSGLNDVWVLTHANGLGGTPAWTQLIPTGSAPTSRYTPSAVYDNTHNRMTIMGGYASGHDQNDVWVLDNADTVDIKNWMLY